jgi:rhodanese-related sulfurtransferase
MASNPEFEPRIAAAPQVRAGFFEARPGDVVRRDDLLLIDVRHREDLVGDLGHIHGVRHWPAARLEAEGLPQVEKARPIVVLCQNGRRSRKCAEALVRFGYREVYHLVGGMLRWSAEERPVAKKQTWRPLADAAE